MQGAASNTNTEDNSSTHWAALLPSPKCLGPASCGEKSLCIGTVAEAQTTESETGYGDGITLLVGPRA